MSDQHALFYALLKRDGLPLPTPEYRFAPPRKWRFDFMIRPPGEVLIVHQSGGSQSRLRIPGVAVEVEGGAYSRGRHVRPTGFLKDCEKYSEAAAGGWLVIRVPPDQLCTLETVALIRRALGA